MKLFYPSGLISLIGIFFIFNHYANSYQNNSNLRVVDLYTPREETLRKLGYVGNYPPNRNYLTITLTGDDKEDVIKLDYAQLRIRELIQANDSINGVHFAFTDASEYWAFIRVLDIFLIENGKRWIVEGNNVWFYHVPPKYIKEQIQTFICGTTYANIKEEEKPFWISAKAVLIKAWKSSWQIIVGFLVVAFVSIYSIYRRNKSN